MLAADRAGVKARAGDIEGVEAKLSKLDERVI